MFDRLITEYRCDAGCFVGHLLDSQVRPNALLASLLPRKGLGHTFGNPVRLTAAQACGLSASKHQWNLI